MINSNSELLILLMIVVTLFLVVLYKLYRTIKGLGAEMKSQEKKINTLKSVILDNHNNLKEHMRFLVNKGNINTYRQIISAQEIEKLVKGVNTRGLRGWAISPDALLIVLDYIKIHKPSVILEFGGGYSTAAISLFVKENKLKTKIISVDHDKRFLTQTEKLIADNVDVSLIYAPMKDYKGYKWYDDSIIKKSIKLMNAKVDLVIIDGPPESINVDARKPVFDILPGVFSRGYTIILDDADRPDERAAVEYWLSNNKSLKHRYVDTEKGLSILTSKSDVDLDSFT